MTKLQAIREFTTYVLGEYCGIARMRMDENWFMRLSESKPYIGVPKNFDYELTFGDKLFRIDFIHRCPIADDFSDITLSILHECGHWATRNVYDAVEYDKYETRTDDVTYFTNPWEILATQWAICWLLSPANQQLAHEFEEKFFGRW